MSIAASRPTSDCAVVGYFLLEQLAGEHVVQLVPALVRDDPPADRPADEVQVADQVEHLVAGAFVGEAELLSIGPVGRDDQQLLGRQVLAQAAGAQLLGFVLRRRTCGRARAALTKSSSPRRKLIVCRPIGAGASKS